jgi:pyridoxal 5'-phosphate synthase pdxS subunit
MSDQNGSGDKRANAESFEIKVGLAEMLKGGVIMDVTNPEQAKIAEDAGATAVMALERVPSDIRKDGGVARMCSIEVIEGHDYRSPFVCGARNLGEALRRIGEGAAMIRTKGEAGSGNIVEAVRHLRSVFGDIRRIGSLAPEELPTAAKELGAPIELIRQVAAKGKLPVPNFAAGGIATPADAALCMSLGAEAVFVGSGIFKSQDPPARARAVVHATTHWDEAEEVLNASRGLADAMPGIEMETLAEHERMANRGW